MTGVPTQEPQATCQPLRPRLPNPGIELAPGCPTGGTFSSLCNCPSHYSHRPEMPPIGGRMTLNRTTQHNSEPDCERTKRNCTDLTCCFIHTTLSPRNQRVSFCPLPTVPCQSPSAGDVQPALRNERKQSPVSLTGHTPSTQGLCMAQSP